MRKNCADVRKLCADLRGNCVDVRENCAAARKFGARRAKIWFRPAANLAPVGPGNCAVVPKLWQLAQINERNTNYNIKMATRNSENITRVTNVLYFIVRNLSYIVKMDKSLWVFFRNYIHMERPNSA